VYLYKDYSFGASAKGPLTDQMKNDLALFSSPEEQWVMYCEVI
jgi:hypothetical protein